LQNSQTLKVDQFNGGGSVERELVRRLPNGEAKKWQQLPIEDQWRRINTMLDNVDVKAAQIELALIGGESVCIPIILNPRANGMTIISSDGDDRYPRVDRALVHAVVRASRWRELLEAGKARTPYDIARLEKCRVSYVQRHLPLGFLAPSVVESVVDGRQPHWCVLSLMLKQSPYTSWVRQGQSSPPQMRAARG
jgi:hypothetical protein